MGPHVTVGDMKSKLANAAEQQLIDAAKRMTPAQRLRAFIEHSRRMVQLQQAGKELRTPQASNLEESIEQSDR
jgi:hypothetical protein